MSFQDAIKSVFTQYVGFSGRARRSEYWYFFLFNLIVSTILNRLGAALGITILSGIWSLAVLLPSYAVCIRRLHDVGKSGWYILMGLIPIAGAIILIVAMCTDSKPDNQYGPNPKNSAYGSY